MNKISIGILSGIILCTFIACGPSTEEKAMQQKNHDEALIKAGEEKMQLKMAWQDSVKRFESMKQDYENQLIEEKATLEAENDRMNQIKEFELLRSQTEREEQIKDQKILIQRIEKNIEILKNNINVCTGNIKESENQVALYQ